MQLQPFFWEAALAALFFLLLLWAVRAVRRRRAFATLTAETELPHLDTRQRVTGIIRRVFRDPAQGVWLVTAEAGGARLTFCATDYERAADRYRDRTGKPADIALFALATLAAGGVEAMKHQIKDADKVELRPDLVTLVPEGQYANDHVVIGRVLDAREDAWDEMPLTVYRTEVVRRPGLALVLDLAVPRDSTPSFPPRSLVHGSARLFGYLAS
jgi:hypothetical protein